MAVAPLSLCRPDPPAPSPSSFPSEPTRLSGTIIGDFLLAFFLLIKLGDPASSLLLASDLFLSCGGQENVPYRRQSEISCVINGTVQVPASIADPNPKDPYGWAFWIRIRIRILLSSSKNNSKKNLDSYCFVTFLWFLIFEKGYKCAFKK
jgi:hypothetical protein